MVLDWGADVSLSTPFLSLSFVLSLFSDPPVLPLSPSRLVCVQGGTTPQPRFFRVTEDLTRLVWSQREGGNPLSVICLWDVVDIACEDPTGRLFPGLRV